MKVPRETKFLLLIFFTLLLLSLAKLYRQADYSKGYQDLACDTSKIFRLTITYKSQVAEFRRSGRNWKVVNNHGVYTAEKSKVDKLLEELAQMQATSLVVRRHDDNFEKIPDSAVVVKCFSKSGRQMKRYFIGSQRQSNLLYFKMYDIESYETFVATAPYSEVFLVSGKLRSIFIPQPDLFREKTLIEIEPQKIQKIEIIWQSNKQELRIKGDAWYFANGAKASAYVRMISNYSGSEFYYGNLDIAELVAKVVFHLSGNRKEELKLLSKGKVKILASTIKPQNVFWADEKDIEQIWGPVLK